MSKGAHSPNTPSDDVAQDLIAEFFATILTATLLGVLGFTVFGGQFADLYMTLRGTVESTGEVAVVSIGPGALHAWDPSVDWAPTSGEHVPTPRPLLAKLVEVLDQAGARVIVLDVLMDRPAPGDSLLVAAARDHGTVIGGEMPSVNNRVTGGLFAQGVPPTLEGGLETAHTILQLEEPVLFTGDMIVRGAPMALCYERGYVAGAWPKVGDPLKTSIGRQIVPSIGLAGAWSYRQLGAGASADMAALELTLERACGGEEAVNRCVHAARDLDCETPDFENGLVLPDAPNRNLQLNYLGREGQLDLPVVDALDLLRQAAYSQVMKALEPSILVPLPDEVSAAVFDKLVVIGRTDSATVDRHATPYGFPAFSGADMAGLYIQAQVMDGLLAQRRLTEAPGWILAIITIGVLVLTLWAHRKLHALQWVCALLLSYLILIGAGLAVFLQTDGCVIELGIPLSVSVLLSACLLYRDLILGNVTRKNQ